MKIIQLIFSFIILITQQAWSNNVQVSNVRLTNQNTTDDFTIVEFDISWENSWRYSNGPANWDAAWIFIKYRAGNGETWKHAWLNNTGHQSCASTTIENGLLTPGSIFNSTTNPSLGVFLFRSVPGTGNFSCQDVQLRWNYGANGVSDNAQVDIKVIAIEMVYIPQGSFYVGSGGGESGAFYTYPLTTAPFFITSESSIIVGTQAGNLYYPFAFGYSGDQAGPVPAAFPKGYAAFYAMKYEISQSGYVDFLNTLTRQQQIKRVRVNLMVEVVSPKFVMANNDYPYGRNGICCRQSIPPVPGSVEFFFDLNNNGSFNESNDGQNIVCGWLNYADVSAYLDWAALRLMTEFEFEKCGRGPLAPLANEYAWGDHVVNIHTGLLNAGSATEIPNDNIANIASTISGGPLRTGAFARSTSNRTYSGSGYYGCMELSGSVLERGVTIGNPGGRSYTGTHGNGVLLADGNTDVSVWPSPTTAVGAFIRGGMYLNSPPATILSEREVAAFSVTGAGEGHGGRGVRTSQ